RTHSSSPTTPRRVLCTLSLHDALPIFHLLTQPSFTCRPACVLRAHLSQYPPISSHPLKITMRYSLAVVALAAAVQASPFAFPARSEEHTSELQSPYDLVCSLLLEKKNG